MAYPVTMRASLFAALALVSGLACSAEEVVWPISKSDDLDADHISSPFGPRDQSGTYDFHAGVDFPVEEGTKVRSIKAGTVEKIEVDDGGAGNWVLVDHGEGEKSAYLHLSKIRCKAGDELRAGDLVGLSGSSGGTTPHLHLNYMVGVERNGADEAMARNALEILPHTQMPDPEVEWTAEGVILTVAVAPMTVQAVRLEGEGQVVEVDYADIVARGNPARDYHNQGGLYIDVNKVDSEHFALTLEPSENAFVPDQVVLTDYYGERLFSAARE
ncbi:M23 family metallopeptidase [Pseudenhygromyxa sp. WMMC2535]|uniref:M23 family metallopeptidase n=1 Tax=Pseudenhygromyxa sp. WMMC2535 TaxID=2712867 RepID=UPI0015950F7A|nr:M23 family metallopeptidase [Pseudenhygromyxa sp. WMMC2535]NVB37136.1 M23 family metallopeptidase [Pseudenhygromyxa sp. WMMC2535]